MQKTPHKTVLVGGCFDILHYGHIHFLKKAKGLGTYLVVALESDQNIKKLKGNGRPIHSQIQRREILESIDFVDEVISLPDSMTDNDYWRLVESVKPQIIAVTKGDPIIDKKRNQAEKFGAKLIEIEKIKVPSTSQIINILDVE